MNSIQTQDTTKKKLKNFIIGTLQKGLGFQNYLSIFSLYKIAILKYDKGENTFLQFVKLLPKDGIVLDIGANLGLMTVHLAKELKESTIYSFEPIPCNLTILKRNVSRFRLNNVQVMDCALGAEEGIAKMILPVRGKIKKQGLCHIIENEMDNGELGSVFETRVRTLDTIEELSKSPKRITGMKLDVEGFEHLVLRGGRALLERNKPVLYCELARKENKSGSFELLQGMGYKVYVNDTDKLVPYNPEIHFTQDYFFIHPDTQAFQKVQG